MISGERPNRASVLTPPGRGAVAVVAIEGPIGLAVAEVCFCAANGRPLGGQVIDRVVFGHWEFESHLEEVVAVRTGDDSLEVHCHGGIAASQRLAAALVEAGCEIVSGNRWLELHAASMLEAEVDKALAKATTRRTAAILLEQRSGALVRNVDAVRLTVTRGDLKAAARQLQRLISMAEIGLHLTRPWLIAIAGKPNVGKSSLINLLAGYERAIVFHEPGTTRDVLSVETAIDGWPVRLTDTAGIRETSDPIESEGVRLARRQLAVADLALWVLDASMLCDREGALALPQKKVTAEMPDRTEVLPMLFAINKTDLIGNAPRRQIKDTVWISALHQIGIDELLAEISHRLVPAPPRESEGVPFTERQLQLLKQALANVEQGDPLAAIQELRQLG
jgi:tRNA modification GTPase